jgi:hypothetical protein
MKIRHSFIILVIAAILLSGFSTVSAKDDGGEYFPRYGHWVRGEFLTLYHTVSDPSRIFGEPITAVFSDPLRPGIEIQYFERARMDYDPSKPEGKRVNLANLGEFVYADNHEGQPAGFSTATNMCRQIPENGPWVCFAFLQFYDANNGAVYFGKPLADAEFVDGRLVQYFERARMEWRTEMPAGQRVVLTELGQIDFDRRIGNSDLLKAEQSNIISLTEPRVYAFTNHPLIANEQKQQLYILVTDQYNFPLSGVQVMVSVTYPGNRVENHVLGATTNKDGIVEDEFTVSNVQPNQVISVSVEANVSAGVKATTQTWFRTWW